MAYFSEYPCKNIQFEQISYCQTLKFYFKNLMCLQHNKQIHILLFA